MYTKFNEYGLSVIPLKNGCPQVKWIEYQSELPTYDVCQDWEQKYNEYALVCGKISQVIAIDIDVDDAELIAKIESIAGQTPVKKFGSKGITLFYRYNSEKTHIWKKDNKVVIELLSDKRLCTIPPSKHRSTGKYYIWVGQALGDCELPILPAYFIDVVSAMFPQKQSQRIKLDVPIVEREIGFIDAENMLGYISADCSRDDWVQVGMALKDEFGDGAFNLWHNWSSKGRSYDAKQANYAWRSFGNEGITIATLIFYAKKDGFLFQSEKKEYEIDLSYLEKKQVATTFLDNIPNSLVKTIYNWILATSYDPQPLLALAASLCAVGTIKGHYVRDKFNLRTNIMAMGLLPAGFGKDHARKCVANIFNQAGIKHRLSGSPASAQALLSSLHHDGGVKLLQLDEIGRMLESIKSKNASSHQKDILTEVMMLFSSASTYYHGREYANRKENPTRSIEQPCLSVYGVTVPENLYDNLDSREAIDGFLARWLIFKADNVAMDNDNALDFSIVPNNIIQEIAKIKAKSCEYVTSEVTPTIIAYTIEAEQYALNLRREYKQKMIDAVNNKTGLNAIYSRCWEHTMKLALTVCNDKNITLNDLEWSHSIVEHSTKEIIAIAKDHISDSEFDADCKFVLNKIKDAGKISHSQLYRKVRKFKAKDFLDILQSLLDREQISFNELKSTKTQKVYFCV